MERLKKKLSEQESQLLLNSPNMPLRVHNRNGKVGASDSQPFCQIWFSSSNSFSMFLLMLTVRVGYAFQSYIFLISSDYERAEWKEVIREQQKKCEWHCHWNQDLNWWLNLNLIPSSTECLLIFQALRASAWHPWSFRCSPTLVSNSRQSISYPSLSIKMVRKMHRS